VAHRVLQFVGKTALTRMLCGASSFASVRISPTTPRFAATQWATFEYPLASAVELVRMIDPALVSINDVPGCGFSGMPDTGQTWTGVS
jgi:hypothetical protein